MDQIYPLMLLSWPSNHILHKSPAEVPFINTLLPPSLLWTSPLTASPLSKMMSSSVIIWGARRVWQISLPVDIS